MLLYYSVVIVVLNITGAECGAGEETAGPNTGESIVLVLFIYKNFSMVSVFS